MLRLKIFFSVWIILGAIAVQAQQTDLMKSNTEQKTSSTNTTSQVTPQLSLSNKRINADAPDILGSLQNYSFQNTTFPVEGAINADVYIVGPNDLFNFGIYGYINQQIPLYVNVEGAVVIPTVGEIKVSGLTLNEAKKKVVSTVQKRYYNSSVSFSLMTPRTFFLKVNGLAQGSYEVTSMTRPSQFIYRVFYDTLNYSKARYKTDNKRDNLVPTFSLRNIEILHKDGSVSNVDIYKYYSTNDDKYNPFFREGDILKLPMGIIDYNYITVEGAVQLGGVYEYNSNDDLETVIGLGRGFDVNAEPDSISVFRNNPETMKYEVIKVSYNNDKNFKIMPYDRIFANFKYNNVKNLSVSVLGEIKNPGIYPITFKNTTLKEIVEIAGGFKPTAYLPLCLIIRKYDEEYTKRDTNELMLNIRANDLIVKKEDRDNFETDLFARRNRLVVDFEKLFKENDQSQNVILENKDVIYINDDKKIVYVYGQVSSEGYVTYKPGEDFEYYIDKAGGYSLAADEGNARIIRFNSRGWYKADKTEVMSGDFIYVPKVVKAPFSDNVTLIATIITTLVSVISTYLLIKSANN